MTVSTSRLQFEWVPSPNFTPSEHRAITCLVVHATATSGIESPRRWLCDPTAKKSAHYLIGKDGTVLQLVQDKDIAWHAGESEWKGKKWVNHFSIGIELVNLNDGKDPYPLAQLNSCQDLLSELCQDYGVNPIDVIGHKDVAPGRKSDPVGFPFEAVRKNLATSLTKEITSLWIRTLSFIQKFLSY